MSSTQHAQYKMEASVNDKQNKCASPRTPHTVDSSFSSEVESNGKLKTSSTSASKVTSDAKPSRRQKHVSYEQVPPEGDKKGANELVTAKNSTETEKHYDQLDRKIGNVSFDQSKSSSYSHGGEISQSISPRMEVHDSTSSSCNSVTKELNKGRYKKGLNAKFLRHNPRFVNEPICHVLPNETSACVGDCMQWGDGRDKGQSESGRKIPHTLDSTSRCDYQTHTSDQRPPPLNKHTPPARINGIAPLINEPRREDVGSKFKEHISYRHQYNCRTDPNEPVRGKLHGSFVWENKEHSKMST